jgi:nitrogen fixation protein NifU and related proteins
MDIKADLYRDELMEIYKDPQHKGKVDNPSVEAFGKNPMCGDEITLQLKIEDNVIKDAKFFGSACVVSVIASELLTEELIGLSVAEAAKLDKDDLLGMLSLNLTTSRVKCATLVLTALKQALANYERHQK